MSSLKQDYEYIQQFNKMRKELINDIEKKVLGKKVRFTAEYLKYHIEEMKKLQEMQNECDDFDIGGNGYDEFISQDFIYEVTGFHSGLTGTHIRVDICTDDGFELEVKLQHLELIDETRPIITDET